MAKNKKEEMPDVEMHLFIGDGNLALVRHQLSKLFMRGKTGILIMRPAEFISKTEFKKRYPDRRGDLEYLDPNRNVVSSGVKK